MKKNKVPFFNLSLNFQELPWKQPGQRLVTNDQLSKL
jgi:hypothetical protein